MVYSLLADAVVVLHVAFVVFVVLGGLLVWRWEKVAWIHVPAAVWGALIEFTGWICPLTPLENWLRTRAGEAGYTSGFVEHYLVPILYPAGLTPTLQVLLGLFVLAINGAVYGGLLIRYRRRTKEGRERG